MDRRVVEDVTVDKDVLDGGLNDDVASSKNELEPFFFQDPFRQACQNPLEAVADQHDLGERLDGPVGPQQVVGQVFRTMGKVEQRSFEGLVFAFLVFVFDRKF